MKINDGVKVAQSCLTLCNPMDCSPPGSSVHGIIQARILEWIVISFSNIYIYIYIGLPWWLSGKECACNAGDLSSFPRLGRPPGVGNVNPLWYSCLDKPTDREAW